MSLLLLLKQMGDAPILDLSTSWGIEIRAEMDAFPGVYPMSISSALPLGFSPKTSETIQAGATIAFASAGLSLVLGSHGDIRADLGFSSQIVGQRIFQLTGHCGLGFKEALPSPSIVHGLGITLQAHASRWGDRAVSTLVPHEKNDD